MEQQPQALRDRSMTRRRALQAGVATGVGAAAFAGPQIGMLGQVPAYAQTCSKGVATAEGTTRNVTCQSSCAPYFFLQTESVSVTFGPSTYTFTVEGCTNTDADWTIPTTPPTVECEVRVIPVVGGVDQPSIVVPGTDYCRETGPNNCGAAGYSCSSQYRIQVRCAQVGCL